MLVRMRSTTDMSHARCASAFVAVRPGNIIGAEALLASIVVDRDGHPIGRLHDIMVDLRRGRIAYGLLTLDRVEAPAERLIAVPWNAMHMDAGGNLRVNAPRDRVERGPSMPTGWMADLHDHEWAEFVHAYFGARPYWEHSAQHG
jgi:sporulation protein YlmC with PRC-barrel domain